MYIAKRAFFEVVKNYCCTSISRLFLYVPISQNSLSVFMSAVHVAEDQKTLYFYNVTIKDEY